MINTWKGLAVICLCLPLLGAEPLDCLRNNPVVAAKVNVISPKAQFAKNVLFQSGKTTAIEIDPAEKAVVKTAVELLQHDVQAVFDSDLALVTGNGDSQIIAGTIGQSSVISSLVKTGKLNIKDLRGRWETFLIAPVEIGSKRKLVVVGSDSRGTAYGLLEISRMIGVSPWVWWADAIPTKKKQFFLPGTVLRKSPSVQFRGIFLNDEDWGLNPWSSQTFEPGLSTPGRTKGAIGPRTYAKIFELLLRLRANTIWPAMHEVTVPFYFVKGNKEAADRYGIIVGTSHCEPLMRNSATEWDLAGKGEYNYLTNRGEILSYWAERLKELKGSENIYTLGLRGKHDGMMQGVKTLEEHKSTLAQVLRDERDLLQKLVNPQVARLPQVFIPYKEVLDVYNDGLKVPDDVTLVWCDDNYGYLTHFPTPVEAKRSGGNGIYYHASYWGRPHDYLWLGTASPGLLAYQMGLAYEKGARKLWILNVGDLKSIEYQTELFLDMAWNIKAGKDLKTYSRQWLTREFGNNAAQQLVPMMQTYYRLAYIRKPEFMGNTRAEEQDPSYNVVKDLPWSETEIRDRLNAYDQICRQAQQAAAQIPPAKKDSYFELIQYPVQAASQMNKKLLYAQLARHGKVEWQQSDAAYDSIVTLSNTYNGLRNGKWKGMVDYQPRRLPVFDKIRHEQSATALPEYRKPLHIFQVGDLRSSSTGQVVLNGLGYQGKALLLLKGKSLKYSLPNLTGDSLYIEVHLLPSHPVTGHHLRFALKLDQAAPQVLSYETQGRSEEWKMNVLTNQAIRKVILPVHKGSAHVLTFTAIDDGIVLDEIKSYDQRP